MSLIIQPLSTLEFSALAPILVDIYIDAMGYEKKIRSSRIKAWRLAVTERNFQAVCAHDNTHVYGVAYGYHGSRIQWWDQEIRRGLRERGGATSQELTMLNNYFSLMEVHVSPVMQGKGIGRELLKGLLSKANAPFTLLSTPEVPHEANNAFGLYRSLGFFDVLRNFYFRGDDRAFAILANKI
ncbi:acetyltransferase (GNAT) family protein [Corynebacterium mustelae]|uniref:Acetyltransferase (GNAT) family protein n=1 Tax=Corynebacterium mustelae TaxID=571915 RepID=A0A0G3H3U0_9CORY|nr:GNAT family N-acetyltransferase [Corynebacterium mustelae]AKK06498.1 acetyltransferase (GNAT) family protein [Corynebacterium mustelae]